MSVTTLIPTPDPSGEAAPHLKAAIDFLRVPSSIVGGLAALTSRPPCRAFFQ